MPAYTIIKIFLLSLCCDCAIQFQSYDEEIELFADSFDFTTNDSSNKNDYNICSNMNDIGNGNLDSTNEISLDTHNSTLFSPRSFEYEFLNPENFNTTFPNYNQNFSSNTGQISLNTDKDEKFGFKSLSIIEPDLTKICDQNFINSSNENFYEYDHTESKHARPNPSQIQYNDFYNCETTNKHESSIEIPDFTDKNMLLDDHKMKNFKVDELIISNCQKKDNDNKDSEIYKKNISELNIDELSDLLDLICSEEIQTETSSTTSNFNTQEIDVRSIENNYIHYSSANIAHLEKNGRNYEYEPNTSQFSVSDCFIRDGSAFDNESIFHNTSPSKLFSTNYISSKVSNNLYALDLNITQIKTVNKDLEYASSIKAACVSKEYVFVAVVFPKSNIKIFRYDLSGNKNSSRLYEAYFTYPEYGLQTKFHLDCKRLQVDHSGNLYILEYAGKPKFEILILSSDMVIKESYNCNKLKSKLNLTDLLIVDFIIHNELLYLLDLFSKSIFICDLNFNFKDLFELPINFVECSEVRLCVSNKYICCISRSLFYIYKKDHSGFTNFVIPFYHNLRAIEFISDDILILKSVNSNSISTLTIIENGNVITVQKSEEKKYSNITRKGCCFVKLSDDLYIILFKNSSIRICKVKLEN